ncbi:MAG: PASTA domain-containing protein [Gemmatimonadetes bacterium]|nr:PASTA domain-containing protein [Gemmatimonadota bacterium]
MMRVRRHLPPGIDWGAAWAGVRGAARRRGTGLYVGTFLVTFIVGYAIAALVLFPAPIFASSKSVPRVIGMTLDDARQAITNAGLNPERSEAARHVTAPAGTVVWQDPPAGVVVPQGSGVQLSVSQGPPRIPVPDVVGYEESTGRTLMEAAGLRVTVDPAQTAAPKGVIVNTRPPAGATLPPGGRVTLVVSIGAPTITVPDLNGLTLEEARAVLEQVGLTLGTYFRRTSGERPGTIIQQTPAPGTLSAPGAAVDLILARRGSP